MFPFTELSPQAVDTKTLAFLPCFTMAHQPSKQVPKFRALKKTQPIDVKLNKSTSLLPEKALLFLGCSQEPGTMNQRDSKAGCDPKSLQ